MVEMKYKMLNTGSRNRGAEPVLFILEGLSVRQKKAPPIALRCFSPQVDLPVTALYITLRAGTYLIPPLKR